MHTQSWSFFWRHPKTFWAKTPWGQPRGWGQYQWIGAGLNRMGYIFISNTFVMIEIWAMQNRINCPKLHPEIQWQGMYVWSSKLVRSHGGFGGGRCWLDYKRPQGWNPSRNFGKPTLIFCKILICYGEFYDFFTHGDLLIFNLHSGLPKGNFLVPPLRGPMVDCKEGSLLGDVIWEIKTMCISINIIFPLYSCIYFFTECSLASQVKEEAQQLALIFETVGAFKVKRKGGKGKQIFGTWVAQKCIEPIYLNHFLTGSKTCFRFDSVTAQDLVDIIKAQLQRYNAPSISLLLEKVQHIWLDAWFERHTHVFVFFFLIIISFLSGILTNGLFLFLRSVKLGSTLQSWSFIPRSSHEWGWMCMLTKD